MTSFGLENSQDLFVFNNNLNFYLPYQAREIVVWKVLELQEELQAETGTEVY